MTDEATAAPASDAEARPRILRITTDGSVRVSLNDDSSVTAWQIDRHTAAFVQFHNAAVEFDIDKPQVDISLLDDEDALSLVSTLILLYGRAVLANAADALAQHEANEIERADRSVVREWRSFFKSEETPS